MQGRKTGLLPLELSILETGIAMRREGWQEFHGFLAASHMRDAGEAKLLTARGTLYKALDRLQRQGFLASRWEDPDVALQEGRPRRRLYRITPSGEAAVNSAPRAAATAPRSLQPGGTPL
jgi:DNA-binding PadR family transcriptional regulator